MLNESQNIKLAENAKQAEQFLKLLANQYRLQILCSLVAGERSVGELESLLNLSQSALSQHLAKLRESEVVATEKKGQMVYYRLASIEANAILSTLYLIYCKD